ncbi:MAG: ABC transporter permease [Gammaproteobacteria bacterium]
MTPLLLEIRQSARRLVASPAYSAGVFLTLTLGVGAAAAVFALIDGVLLSGLPFPEAERLVVIRQQNAENEWNTSVVDFQAVASQNRSFEAVAAMQSMDVILTGGEQSQWVSARWVTADFFNVMGVMPTLGRGFRPGEDRPGAAPVVVLGHAFAERHFGEGVDAVGRTLTLDGIAYTVVGVMPSGINELPVMRADVWPAMQLAEPERRGPFLLNTVARLKPGVSLARATDDLAAISRRIFPQWQAEFQDETARLTPKSLHSAIVGNAGDFLWIAFGAVFVVLLIAVANIANLVLMRVTERAQDLAVRAALGASRKRLARLLMTESLLLAVAGGIAGIGLAALLLELYRAFGPELPRLAEVAIDSRVAGFAAVVVLLSGIFFGTIPLLFDTVGKSNPALHQVRAGAGRGQHLFRSGLVALEFALALPLLIAAGLLINSLVQLQRVDPGFEADHVLTARVRLLESNYPDDEARMRFWERVLPDLHSIPGVSAVGLATGVPPDSPGTYNNFDIVGRPDAQGKQPMSPWTPATPGYLDALGLRLLDGRWFDTRDTPDSTPVVVVSAAWAKRYFPGESAIGKQLYEGGDTSEPVTVIGVVSDVKFDGLGNPGESVYAAINQGWSNNPIYLYLHTGPEPLALVEPLRAKLRQIDPALVPAEVTTLQSRLRDSLSDQRHWAVVIAGFALSAVLLSAVGVFGVLGYYVSRQYREIGIRLALGADAPRILRLVIRRGFGSALAGTLAGIVLAMFLTRGLETLLFDVTRMDPLTLIGACGLLLGIALAACWLPARRAARVDPTIALRYE